VTVGTGGQASVYRVDFEAERKSREELNDERLQLQEKLIATEEELHAVKMAGIQHRRGSPGASRHSAGVVEQTASMGDIHRQQRQTIAQEQMTATPGGAAAAPAEVQPANRATTEVSLTDRLA